MLVFLSALMIIYIWQSTVIVEKKYRIENLLKQKNELEKRISQLEITYNELSAVNRIEKIAKEKLKMVYPEKINFLLLSDS